MTALQHSHEETITEEKLVTAVNILADLVQERGPAFRPLYHQLRQQLAKFRRQQQADAAPAAIAAQGQSKVA